MILCYSNGYKEMIIVPRKKQEDQRRVSGVVMEAERGKCEGVSRTE